MGVPPSRPSSTQTHSRPPLVQRCSSTPPTSKTDGTAAVTTRSCSASALKSAPEDSTLSMRISRLFKTLHKIGWTLQGWTEKAMEAMAAPIGSHRFRLDGLLDYPYVRETQPGGDCKGADDDGSSGTGVRSANDMATLHGYLQHPSTADDPPLRLLLSMTALAHAGGGETTQ
ncbi:hypothetical protein CGC21_6010 [Leishmania donovani]|uniref:Uncharacterized protein n=1 Tax=Leishmania donovani TaxID=5661 RepID=A0A504XB51_LEIDO|nr:hypothetical protein CGC21_6010 [Leishmania donovani]